MLLLKDAFELGGDIEGALLFQRAVLLQELPACKTGLPGWTTEQKQR